MWGLGDLAAYDLPEMEDVGICLLVESACFDVCFPLQAVKTAAKLRQGSGMSPLPKKKRTQSPFLQT